MKTKEKMMLTAFVMAVGTILTLFFTAALDYLLSREATTLTFIPLTKCIVGLFTRSQQRMLFLSFEGMLAICCILFWTQNSKSYQSELMKITDDISTPTPVGQFQHGSSRWLREKEKQNVFETQFIDPREPVIQMLLETGYDEPVLPVKMEELEVSQTSQEPDTTNQTEIRQGISGEDKSRDALSASINHQNKRGDDHFESVEYDPFKKQRQVPKEQSKEEKLESDKDSKDLKKQTLQTPGQDPYQIFPRGGIVVGKKMEGKQEKIYYIGDDTHTLTIGATRSGKTRCLVIQSICFLALGGESLVISDPKAELYHYTAAFLEKLGYEVICLDFRNPEKSSRYNLLQPVIDAVNAGDIERAESYAWDITNILVGDNTSNEKIWENGEKSTIAAAILCVVVDNQKRPVYQNLTNVYWFIAEMSKAVGGKTSMSLYMKKLPNNHPAKALMSIAEVAPSRTKGSFDTSALTTLRLFTSRSVYSITHKSDYNIAEIGTKKQALFLILPDEKTTYYPIAGLMVSQLYELLVLQSDLRGGRLKRRVNFVLDEFGNFTKLNDFTNKLTVAGGRGIRFNLFLQSFEQLTQKYDKETAAIVKSNCQSWIYLQADDKETLQDVCDKLGKYTTSAYQLSSQHGTYVNPSSSHSISLVARDLLTTDEIRRITRPHQIVISRAHPALMTAPDLSQWYCNQMCGLGDQEHNRKVREKREAARPVISKKEGDIPLWNIWVYYTKDLQLKETQQKAQSFGAQMGSMFSEKMLKKGGSNPSEEKD